MEDQELESPWSQLVFIGEGGEKEVIPIIGSQLSIGRKSELVDFVIPDNRHVSGSHCILTTRNSGSKVTLKDTSTNGTLLNGKRLQKNVEMELVHNDVIAIVQRKEDASLNVAFRFENLRQSEYLEDTLPYEPDSTVEGEKTKEEEKAMNIGITGKKRKLDEECHKEGIPSAKINPAQQVSPSPSIATKPASVGANPNEAEAAGESIPPKPAIVKMGSIEETLICQICQEILHDCVSLQPCMHSYCAGCYSEWMDHSSACPACRKKVKRISKNHIINNLVDAYLRANPDRMRPAEDLQELDARNKITHDMLYPKKKHGGYDDDDDYTDDSDDSDSSLTFPSSILTSSTFLPLALCQQCPGNAPPSSSLQSFPYHYTCTSSTRHVSCSCCLRSMPDRNDPSMPQKCELCSRHFCHLYWGCNKPGCLGCLAPFKDLNFHSTCLNGILGNAYESNIIKEYIESKGLSIKDFLQACCEKMERGEYTCTGSGVTTATITCYNCALKLLKELAYLYRGDIPRADLPVEVTRRVDCYWGKDCRTQFTKPEHAKKFNHVCEKTRHV